MCIRDSAIPKRADIKGKANPSIFKNYKGLLASITGLLILGVVALGLLKFNKNKQPPLAKQKTANPVFTPTISKKSIAVLPFANMSSSGRNDYFSEGIHDDLISHLSKISSLKVISRTSVLRFKETQQPISEIAKLLNVENILEGSVRRAGDQVRINVQLIKALTGERIWSEIYDRILTVDNIFDIQTEIAKEIANALQTNISPVQKIALETKPTQNLEAYDAYLQGRQLLEDRIGTSILAAKKYFKQAVQLDPNFAQAYIKLGEAHYLSVEYASEDSKTNYACLLYTSPSPRDATLSRMPSSA